VKLKLRDEAVTPLLEKMAKANEEVVELEKRIATMMVQQVSDRHLEIKL
jgi:hypothetical protein